MTKTVMDVLTENRRSLLTIEARTTVREAARFFVEYGIASFPVEDEGEICGIVTRRDLTGVLASPYESPDDIIVAELMREDVIVAYPSDNVTEVLRVMARFHIHHMPVVENGFIIGMVSISDLIRANYADTRQDVHLRYLKRDVCPVRGENGDTGM